MIIGVALKNKKDGRLIPLLKPNRHHNIIKWIVDHLGFKQVTRAEWEQGFITDLGVFLNRKEAAQYAMKTRQIIRQTSELFSEDLW